MKVLVTGDRNFSDRGVVFRALSRYHDTYGITRIIEGCARGADSLAEQWCRISHIENEHHPADWTGKGRAAGLIRNTEMLREGQPDVVIAFHDDLESSNGTAHMVKIANKSGLAVLLFGSSGFIRTI